MIENERQAILIRDRYEFLSNERSDRTGGQMWTERVVETASGRVRLLTAVDGRPLTPERVQQEHARLAQVAAHPDDFIRREQAQHNEEERARHMLELLPVDFLFDDVRLADGVWHMDFHPNPAVSPSAIEDRVLHGMSGWIAIDAAQLRLIHIEGKLPQDTAIGFGLLANIRAGSSFSSDRELVGGHWRTVHVSTDIRGKAALFKSISRNGDTTHSDFHYLESAITVPEAVDLLLQTPPHPPSQTASR